MEKLIFDFIDKIHTGYLVSYCTMDTSRPKYECLLLPISIYEWYVTANEEESNTFKLKKGSKYSKVTIVKKIYNKQYYMRLEFNDKYLNIPDNKFTKTAKVYSFQSYISINVYDGNGRLISYNFRFLKNYNTRSKAIYFIEKFAHKFASIYNKYLIDHDISTTNNFELFGGDIIYEHALTFREKYGNGTANYSFMIISVETE